MPRRVELAIFSLYLATACLLAACGSSSAHITPSDARQTRSESLVVGGSSFTIEYSPDDLTSAEAVMQALLGAAPRVMDVWGKPTTTILVRILPSHEDLEIAIGRRGYPWIRAWARYDEILLQSPRTFDLFERGRANLTELLVHELTHCVMYQRAATREDWKEKDRTIPIWFREGMASYTARQGHRRMSEVKLADWRRRTGRDPVAESRALFRAQPEVAYAAAHWAFTLLVERHGVETVADLLDAMRTESSFPRAFSIAVGVSVDVFTGEYIRHLDRSFR